MNLFARLALLGMLALPPVCNAASFDCNRARSKLNRLICSDAELSRLDEVVWTTYGERIRGLTALQYASVRERHILWRRTRGLYEATVEAVTHEYRSHLAWLTHPLLGLEGRYQRGAFAAGSAHFDVEVDLRTPLTLELRGLASAPAAIAWQASARGAPPKGEADATGLPETARSFAVRPLLAATGAAAAEDCELEISFAADEVTITSSPACGKAFDGRYTRTLRE